MRPARTVFAGFAIASTIGALLLMLPISKAGPGGAPPMEALFTAVSALCVTGLTVVDTLTYWTGFGQVVILLLIQLGGFGVMTFASVVGITVIRRLSLRSRLNTATEVKSLGIGDLRSLVLGVVKISLVIEGAVAVLLTLRFATGYEKSLGEATWLGLFHAVSSFNNAGFALFSDNLMSFTTDPFILLPICAAIILGGLGFPVIMQLRTHLHVPRLWSLNTRIVLWGTVVLLVLGAAFVIALEWSNPRTLGALNWPDRILAGFAQSVQTRTAGFNNLDISQMDSSTWLGMDALMFIGGGPAGTAGGIKITTFAVLYFIMLAEIRGDAAVNVFGKRLSRAVHRQAIAVILLATALVATGTMSLLVMTEFSLDQLLFEIISAFGTVGLSTGITAQLPVAGQLILVLFMFIGRLGPITFAAALALQDRRLLYELPKERPIIG
jgi:trk system potassium uptake protein TrkH